MDGLLLATVCSNCDKDHPGMLEVNIPSLSKHKSETFWAQMTTPYAGNQYGIYFLPEVGDSVVVGFFTW